MQRRLALSEMTITAGVDKPASIRFKYVDLDAKPPPYDREAAERRWEAQQQRIRDGVAMLKAAGYDFIDLERMADAWGYD